MKITRLHMRNFRGVAERELQFPRDGVTVCVGDNEIGKSSLFEAFHLALTEKASAQKTWIKDIQPLGKDVGPEVEMDLEFGPYRLSIHKTFLKKSQTELRIHAPTPLQLSGNEAHNHLLELLETEIDLPLLQGLLVQQGAHGDRMDLTDFTSLNRALDQAAGTTGQGEETEPLFDAAHAEFLQYFTPKGSEKADLTRTDEEIKTLQAQVDAHSASLHALEADIHRSERLEIEIAALREQLSQTRTESSKYTKKLEEIRSLKSTAERLHTTKMAAESRVEACEQRLATRKREQEEVQAAIQLEEQLNQAENEEKPALQSAQKALDEAQKQVQVLRETGDKIDKEARVFQADLEHFHRLSELSVLDERIARIEEVQKAAKDAEIILASPPIAQEKLDELEKALLIAEASRVSLSEAGPSLTLEALNEVRVLQPSGESTLSTGETLEFSGSTPVSFEIPDSLRVVLTPGTSLDALRERATVANQRKEVLCRDLDVADMAEARFRYRQQQEARAQLKRRDQTLAQLLGTHSIDETRAKQERLQSLIPSYQEQRDSEEAMLKDGPSTSERLEKLRSESSATREAFNAGEEALRERRRRSDELSQSHQNRTVRIQVLKERREDIDARLKTARTETSDEDLTQQHEEAQKSLVELSQHAQEAQAKLDASGFGKVELLAQNTEAALKGVEQEFHSLSEQKVIVKTRLQEKGEAGLGESLEIAKAELERKTHQQAATRKRALAAQRLYDTLTQCREEARQAYLAPLREQIEELGRLLYNDTFEVQLDKELKLTHRGLNGIHVPWRSLSGGAQEQLDLLIRLAVGLLISKEDGIPLLMDETLVFTDPGRRAMMGALLSRVGQQCQMIILTSDPSRFVGLVGDANVIRFDE